MESSRKIVLAVLIAAVALGVFYMIDPTMMGLMGRREGFEGEGPVITTTGAASATGEAAGSFANSGSADHSTIMDAASNVTPEGTTVSPMTPGNGKKQTAEQFENYEPSPMPFASAERPSNCYPKNQLAPQELLPNDPNSKWAAVNPQGQGDIAGKNFLNAGSLIGVNTVGSSLRNASWDLRSEVPNPQVQVSPWMNSTITPDILRRPMEIG